MVLFVVPPPARSPEEILPAFVCHSVAKRGNLLLVFVRTSNLEPQTSNPEPRTSNLEPRTSNLEPNRPSPSIPIPASTKDSPTTATRTPSPSSSAKPSSKPPCFSDDALDRPIVWHHQHRIRLQPLPRQHVPDLIESVKRRSSSSTGALPMVFPTISIARIFRPSHLHVLPQPPRDGHRGDDPRPARGLRRPHRRLRQESPPRRSWPPSPANLPAIVLPTGPMLTGHYKGEVLGACTDCRRFWAAHRAEPDRRRRNRTHLRPPLSHCRILRSRQGREHHGLPHRSPRPRAPALPPPPPPSPTAAALPKPPATLAAELAIAAAHAHRHPHPAAIRNAMIVRQAIGGSTNGLITSAIANRAGVHSLAEFDDSPAKSLSFSTSKPSRGDHYMEQFHYAGSTHAPPRTQPAPRHLRRTISGFLPSPKSSTKPKSPEPGRHPPSPAPLKKEGAIAVLRRGTSLLRSAVIKHSAASPHLLQHTGRAVVFDSLEDLAARIDSPLDVSMNDILVLRNAGPSGAPGSRPKPATCPSPSSSPAPVSRTWSASPTPACLAPPSAPSSSTSRPNRPSAARSPSSKPATASPSTSKPTPQPPRHPSRRNRPPPRRLERGPPSTPNPSAATARLFHDHILQADQGCGDFDFLLREKAPPT